MMASIPRSAEGQAVTESGGVPQGPASGQRRGHRVITETATTP